MPITKKPTYEEIIGKSKPSYEDIVGGDIGFKTSAPSLEKKPSYEEIIRGPTVQFAHTPEQAKPITDLSAHISELAGIKERPVYQYMHPVSGGFPFGIPDPQFVKGFGKGFAEQTQIPALIGRKLPPSQSDSEKIGRGAGQVTESIAELMTLNAALKGAGMISKAVPKGATALQKALQTGFLFGTKQTTEELRKATAEAIHGEDFGARGGSAVRGAFIFGAVLSLASSGIGAVWNKLHPSEQERALKILGIKEKQLIGKPLKDQLQIIRRAAQRESFKYHPDKVKGMRKAFEKVIDARDHLFKMQAKNIIEMNARQNFVNNISEKVGVSKEAAQNALARIEAGEPIEKVDQMLSQARFGIKPVDQAKEVVRMDTEYADMFGPVHEIAEIPATEGELAPQEAIQRQTELSRAEIPPPAEYERGQAPAPEPKSVTELYEKGKKAKEQWIEEQKPTEKQAKIKIDAWAEAEILKEGKDAAQANQPKSSNPYKKGTIYNKTWEKGWERIKSEVVKEPTASTKEKAPAAPERGEGQVPPKTPPDLTFKEPPRPEGPNIQLVTDVQRLLDEKAMISTMGKLSPGARRLAKQFTGKTDLKKMTEEELSKFGTIIGRLPKPTYNNKGQRVPPSIAKTTAIVKQGEFETQYGKPTFMRLLQAPEYYAEKLGVKDIVQKAEEGKIRFSLEYQQLSNKVDRWIKQVEKFGKTTVKEKLAAKLRNEPTRAVERFRELLDIYEEPPENLSNKEKELFNKFREMTRWIIERENAVRESLDLKPIKYRKGYVRHVAKGLAKEMLAGRYPFPQGRKFWAEEIVAKKMYNSMEMHRTLTEDLERIFSRDLGFAMKSMLWTGLKEIHLSQPIRFLEQQLSARGKDTPEYLSLSPSEKARWDRISTMPARTRRWVKDYVNTTIKGQQSRLDEEVEAIVKETGLNGLLNKLLAPFGRALSHKPIANFLTEMGRLQILGVMGMRPKQIIRNKFQTFQNMALYPLYKETWRTYAPVRALRNTTENLERLLDKSLFLKGYTGTEEWPVDIKSKIAKLKLADYQWSAISNARQAMEAAYWGMMPLFNNPKFKYYKWSDPKRTYTEEPEFLYPSEEKLMLKEMEFGAAATQHNYTPIGMPEIFRHKTLTPITRLQSWWMNHYFRFTQEALHRAFTGRPTYSKEGGPVLPWKYRLGWLRYLLIAVPILNAMNYQRSFLFGAAPTGMPPFAEFAIGLFNYVFGKGKGDDKQKKKGKTQMAKSAKTFIPGYLTYKDWQAIWTGRDDLSSLFFYKKRKKEKPKVWGQ